MAESDGDYFDSSLAVYNTVSLSEEQRTSLFASLNHDLDDAFPQAICAPNGRDACNSLEEAIAHHRELAAAQERAGEQHEYHPYMFLVVDKPEPKKEGVLAVSLNSDGRGAIDTTRLPAQGAAGCLQNIEMGNSSWEETKDEMQDQFENIAADMERSTSTPEADSAVEPLSSPSPQRICVYKLDNGVNMPLLLEKLNGAEAFYERGVSSCTFQIPPWIPFIRTGDDTDNVPVLKDMHYRYVHEYPHFHPDIAILADQVGFEVGNAHVANWAETEGNESRTMRVENVETWVTDFVAGRQPWSSGPTSGTVS